MRKTASKRMMGAVQKDRPTERLSKTPERPPRPRAGTRGKRVHQISEELHPARDRVAKHVSESFVRRIRERGEELSLSLRQIAQRAEIDPSFLTRIISGERNAPSDEIIERLADALEMPPLALFLEAGRVPKLQDGVRRALPAFIDAAGHLSEDQIRTVLEMLHFIRSSEESKK